MRRRTFLIAEAGGTAITLTVPARSAFGQCGISAVELATYPAQKFGRLSELKDGEARAFIYPLEGQPEFVVKLGAPAAGGIGPWRDVVA
jgi:arsenite oxidase small subunit